MKDLVTVAANAGSSVSNGQGARRHVASQSAREPGTTLQQPRGQRARRPYSTRYAHYDTTVDAGTSGQPHDPRRTSFTGRVVVADSIGSPAI